MNKNYKFLIENVQKKENEFNSKIVEYFIYLKDNTQENFILNYSETNLR